MLNNSALHETAYIDCDNDKGASRSVSHQSHVNVHTVFNHTLADSFYCDINDDFMVNQSIPNATLNNRIDCIDPVLSELKVLRAKNVKNIIIAHINVNSIKHKFEYINEIMSEGLVDILCITETKLDNSYSDALFSCKNFKCYRKDKTSKSGGLMIYIRSDIPHNRLENLEIADHKCHVESIVIEFDCKKYKLVLTCVYKNPNVPNNILLEHLSNAYDVISESNNESILVGDINIDMAKGDNIIETQFCTIYDLKNVIKSPTCFKSEKGTLIDPVIVSNTHKMCSPFNIICGISDFHNIVGCVLKHSLPVIKPHRVQYRSYKQFDQNKFKQDVDCIPMNVCNVFDDVSDKYWAFCHMYNSVLDEHAPMKSKVIRSEKIPYMNSTLMKEMHKRNHYKKMYLQNRSNDNWELYRRQRNLVTDMRRNAIKEYFMKNCKTNNPKNFWSTVKPFFSEKCKSVTENIILKDKDNIISDNQSVCNMFNQYFANIANDIGPADQNLCQINDPNECFVYHNSHTSILNIEKHVQSICLSFNFNCVTVEDVSKQLKSINCTKPSGYDCIPPKTVQMCHKELAQPIAMLINTSFEQGQYPSDMKRSEISPVFKKNDFMMKENYRPINIIGIFPKIFESIIAKQIEKHMNNIFNSSLGAYRKGHGCSQVLITAIDEWKRSLDQNNVVGMVLMDLSKAFDAIPHDLLIAKLFAYGFSSNACTFMFSYLTHRMQRVKVKDKRSSWTVVNRGIPQGSCLGPILFNIFINDLFLNIEHASLFNYADDNTLSASGKTFDVVSNILIQDSKRAIRWFTDNFMKANPSKFQLMFLKPNRSNMSVPCNIQIDNCKINSSDEVSLLGITIDNKLNFDQHVLKLCKKAARQLKILIRFKKLLGLKEKEILFKTFILSNFNFCPIVWTFCSKQASRNIEKVQERSLRFLLNDYKSTYNDLLQQSGYSTLHLGRLRSVAIEVFKCVHKLNPTVLNELFIVKETERTLRDPLILHVPKFNKIQYGKKTFSYYGSHLWNILPNDIKRTLDINAFKMLINTWEGPACSCNICVM